ncbi:hypothetical protein Pelo_3760 [Pelomyxa schiedti]|nr:hypothetical protein Pelo_3760 [Pelomyxa schiedti]
MQCSMCHGVIDGRVVDAIQQKWHPQCFICDFCRAPIVSQYSTKYGRPYCVPCERRLYGNYCEACHQPIAGQQISAIGRFYHPNHLVCFVCKVPVQNGFVEHNGKPFCSTCAHNAGKSS